MTNLSTPPLIHTAVATCETFFYLCGIWLVDRGTALPRLSTPTCERSLTHVRHERRKGWKRLSDESQETSKILNFHQIIMWQYIYTSHRAFQLSTTSIPNSDLWLKLCIVNIALDSDVCRVASLTEAEDSLLLSWSHPQSLQITTFKCHWFKKTHKTLSTKIFRNTVPLLYLGLQLFY